VPTHPSSSGPPTTPGTCRSEPLRAGCVDRFARKTALIAPPSFPPNPTAAEKAPDTGGGEGPGTGGGVLRPDTGVEDWRDTGGGVPLPDTGGGPRGGSDAGGGFGAARPDGGLGPLQGGKGEGRGG